MDDLDDLTPTCAELARLVAAVPDDRLDGPTPCPDWTVADLLDHLGGLALAFTAAARHEPLDAGPSGDGAALEAGFRDRIGASLTDLAAAWREPGAREGMTAAGGVEMPGDVAALVALDEVTVHAWDLAVATGQEYAADPAAVEACLAFVATFEPPEDDAPGLFGPPVGVPDQAPALDRLVAATGRDPSWAPARG